MKDILKQSSIGRVQGQSGEILDSEELVDTQGWVRPTLLNGVPVLTVKRTSKYWQTVKEKK